MKNKKGIRPYASRPMRGIITPEKTEEHAQVLTNTLRNRFKHFSKRYQRQGIDCFRLYDWDSKEIRIVVDWYAGCLVVAEYERKQTGPEYLPRMAHAAAAALGVPEEKVFCKRRHTQVKEGMRYVRLDQKNTRIEVREFDLRFWVNPSDFLDTGLFSDHRNTRQLIRTIAKGKDFLNLFCYTGAFTCAAAAGGARSTVSVDRSRQYCAWAKDNMVLNGLWSDQHALVQKDVLRYLAALQKRGPRFDLAFVDPPSFFQEQDKGVSFDINRDHPELLKNVIAVLRPGAELFFSTNHQRFEPHFEGLPFRSIIPLTPKTIPEDYRNRTIHSCWRCTV